MKGNLQQGHEDKRQSKVGCLSLRFYIRKLMERGERIKGGREEAKGQAESKGKGNN